MNETNLTDSLTLIKEVVEALPTSYWASKDTWRVIIMFWTVFNLHGLEGALFALLLKFPKLRAWFKRLAEDSDDEPNLRDLAVLVLIILILWCGRGIVIAGIWQVLFGESQIDLIGTLGAAIIGLCTAIGGLYKVLSPNPKDTTP